MSRRHRPSKALATRPAATPARVEQRNSIDDYYSNIWAPAWAQNYGLQTTYQHMRVTEIANTLTGYMAALRGCPPAFAAQMVRALVLSQARFTFRRRSSGGKGKTFGTRALGVLEQPWPNGTTGQLLTTMEWHAGVAGNAFVTNRTRGRLRVMRPDWTAIVYGSQQEPEDAATALDGELVGYAYANGGLSAPGNGTLTSTGGNRVWTLLPDEVAHYTAAGLTDPEGGGIGMSWLTPALRDMQADKLASEHKTLFFKNGAVPNMIVKGIPAMSATQFNEIVDMLESQHSGIANHYKTLYLTAGADAMVVGNNFKDMDLKSLTALGETRVSTLSRVPAALLGISEGLAGSSLNAGNFDSARRVFADTWVSPTLQDYAASLAPLVDVPADAELWPDTSDMPILRDDSKAAAEIQQVKIAAIVAAVNAGFDPDSAVQAIWPESGLKHTNLLSVQLQAPGSAPPSAGASATDPFADPAMAGV